MKTLWDRLHTWLRANAPVVLASLRRGASAEQIAAAEGAMGVTLPNDVKAAYRIHDGQKALPEQGIPEFLPGGWVWLSLKDVVSGWGDWADLLDKGAFAGDAPDCDPRAPIQPVWWHLRWVPITFNQSGGNQCVDLAPRRGGRAGQIIRVWHDGARSLVAGSLTDWLSGFADDLERGEYEWSDEYGGLMHADEL